MIVAALAIIGVLLALVPLTVYLASEAVIQRRYPLASTTAHAEQTDKQLRRGAHLMTIAGCADCHGANLQGRLLHVGSLLPVYSGNLLRDAQVMSDDELERAIRGAIKPDATSMWLMPSGSYVYMSEDDVGSIISYSRAQSGWTDAPGAGLRFCGPRCARGGPLAADDFGGARQSVVARYGATI